MLARSHLVTSTKDGEDEARIDWITKEVLRPIRKHKPNLVAIENHAFSLQKTGSASKLVELHGVVKNRLFRKELPFIVVASTTLKHEATGNGRADKDMMLAHAKVLWSKCWNHDMADSFWLARYAFKNYTRFVEDPSVSE